MESGSTGSDVGMRILVAGGTGFIGTPLVDRLARAGHECTVLVRAHKYRPDPPPNVSFTPMSELQKVHEVEAVINLAGESVGQEWTREIKQRIVDSRVDTTRKLVDWMAGLIVMPRVFLSGSAVGIYGHRPGEVLTEDSPLDPKARFRCQVCAEWEYEAVRARELGTRTVRLRLGNVIDPAGGLVGMAVPRLRRFPFLVPIAPHRGFSWIAREDAIRMIEFALNDSSIEGPLNVVAPEASNLRTLAEGFGKLIGKPVVGALPAMAARLALGEMGQAITDSQDVRPAKALEHGFEFLRLDLREAMGSA